jgi:hypothetical protein
VADSLSLGVKIFYVGIAYRDGKQLQFYLDLRILKQETDVFIAATSEFFYRYNEPGFRRGAIHSLSSGGNE